MRRARIRLVYGFIFFSLLFSSSDFAGAQLTKSYTTPASGTIRYNQGIPQLKISTNYTGVTKTDPDHLSVPFSHLIYYPSNTLWDIDNAFGNDRGSGGPSVYMSDIDAAYARAEYNIPGIPDMQVQVGNEVYVSNWFFLPSDWVVDSGWYSIADPMQKGASPWHPYIEFWITQPNPPAFVVQVGGRRANSWECLYLNKDGTIAEKIYSESEFPRGRWFNIQWWMRRNPTLGESFIKVWFDGTLICDQTAFPYETGPLNQVLQENSYNSGSYPSGPPFPSANLFLTDLDYPNSYFTTVAKIYHGGTSYIHQLWTDDLEIWDGKP